jgi:Ni,Fe-hydrogenase III small subunit
VTGWRRIIQSWRDARPSAPAADRESAASLAARIDTASQARLGRSLGLLHVDAGSCGGCELELRALTGVFHDLERLGLRFTTTPRHADVMLVTGPATRNLADAVQQAHAAMADPKWVVAIGDCAVDGGVFKGSYAVLGGVAPVVPVDLTIAGCPPKPERILAGLRALLEANARS